MPFFVGVFMEGFALAPPDALSIGLHIIFSAEKKNKNKNELKSKLLQQICDVTTRMDHHRASRVDLSQSHGGRRCRSLQ